MGWLEGLLTGYQKRHYDIAAEKRKEAEDSALREGKALEHLVNSRDPHIKRLAMAGVLDLAKPRQKASGLAGWLGEMEASPHMQTIQRYYDSIPEDEEVETDPVATGGAITTPPPAAGGAALPSTSPVTPGSPNLTQPSLAPGAGSAATPPPRPTFSLAPGAPPAAGGGPAASFAAGASGAVPGAMPGGSGQLLGPPPTPPIAAAHAASAAAGTPAAGASSLMSGASVAAQPQGSPLPGASSQPISPAGGAGAGAARAAGAAGAPGGAAAGGLAAGPPPAPPEMQGGAAGVGLPSLTASAERKTTSLTPVKKTRGPKTDLFPTAADLAAQASEAREEAEVVGNIRGYQRIHREAGNPNWQQDGIRDAMAQKRHAAGYNLLKGAVRRRADGTYEQDWVDGRTGKVVETTDATAPGTTGGGSVDSREMIAFAMFGQEGEDPNSTIRRLTPGQAAKVSIAERREKALTAAEIELTKANYMKDAPLSSTAKNQLIEQLHGKWRDIDAPVRALERNFTEMVTGLQAFNAGEKVASIEMIRVAYEKMLDPNSVVREGEYARQAAGLGLSSRVEGFLQQLRGGGNIPVGDLEGMVETARKLMAVLAGVNETERQRIEDRARQNGIDPGFIFGGGVTPPPVLKPVVPPVVGPVDPNAKPATSPADAWNTPILYDPKTRRRVGPVGP